MSGSSSHLGGVSLTRSYASVLALKDGRAISVTEYVDHIAPVRGARTSADAADARALRAVTTGSSAQLMKVEAFRMLQTI